MTWTNPILLIWMTGLFAAAWLVPRRFQNSAISSVGLLFLAFSAPVSLALLTGMGIFSFIFFRRASKSGWHVAILATAVVSIIVFFKTGVRLDADIGERVVPLGLAFYGLRIIHYVFEAYMRQLPPHKFTDYCQYLVFFPTMIAGPINRFKGFQRDSRRRRWDVALLAVGFERILYGYVKIIVLANYLTGRKLGGWLDGLETQHEWFLAYMGCLKYGLNLYFQFSGYSDIAIGLALLIGFRVEENFNWPFLAVNINDFWQRWHITLSSWCKDYIFMPVSSLTRNPYAGVIASMLILGLWHEISPRYCLWGFYHGLGIMFWQIFQKIKERSSIPKCIWENKATITMSWVFTFNFVILSFAITSASSMEEAWQTLVTIFTFTGSPNV